MIRPSLALLALLASLPLALADEAVPPPFQFPDGPEAWTVDVTYGAGGNDGAASHPQRLQRIEATQDGKGLRRNLLTFGGGVVRERWDAISRHVFLLRQSGGGVVLLGEAGRAAAAAATPFDPPALSWIRPETLQKERTSLQGTACFLYRTGGKQAWIACDTGLPVAVQMGEARGVFAFQTPSPEPLTLPAEFQAQLDLYDVQSGILPPPH